MSGSSLKKPLLLIGGFAAMWLGARFVLPVLLPFLLGAGLALAAEPLVRLGTKRLRFPRWLGTGVGVSATLLGIMGIVSLIGAIAVREIGSLAGNLPDLENTARQGMLMAQDFFVGVSEQAPDGVRPMLQKTVLNFFNDGSVLLDQVTDRVPSMLSAVIGKVGNGALVVGTGVVSAFLISARLPELRQKIRRWLPESFQTTYLPALKRVRKALSGWLKAQLTLSAVTYAIVSVGFVLLKIPYGWAWAFLVALVDAVPVLGTGTVLVPWALVCLFQGQSLQAIGLLLTYGAALTTRTVLEPRLVGRHLGLDPLVTLLALYIGYRFWGILGMLVAPIFASAVKSLSLEEGKWQK